MRAGAFSHCTFYRGSDLTFHVPAFQGNHIEWLAPFSLERSRAQLRCPRLPPAVLVTPLRCVPQRGPRCWRKDSNSINGMDATLLQLIGFQWNELHSYRGLMEWTRLYI